MNAENNMIARRAVWLLAVMFWLLGSIVVQEHMTSENVPVAEVFSFIAAQGVLIGLLVERSRLSKLRERHDAALIALKESEAKNQAILAALPDLMVLQDAEGTYLDYYARNPKQLYVPPERFLGRKMCEIMPVELAERFTEAFKEVFASNAPVCVEYPLMLDGAIQYFEARIVTCGDGRLLSIVRDLTEKKRAEMELEELSSLILGLQDEERRKIAHELHDVTAQNLFAVSVNMEILKEREPSLTPLGREIVAECLEKCEQSLKEVRTLSYTLFPPALDQLGLIPSIRWYVDRFAKRSGIEIALMASDDVGRLPVDVETDVFRIVQEALTNIYRHSATREAAITVEKKGNSVVVQIEDRGHGMAEEVVLLDGLGLRSIRERLRKLGGRLEIHVSGDGRLLTAQVPVPVEVRT
jgi:signal transduction histidine kinase